VKISRKIARSEVGSTKKSIMITRRRGAGAQGAHFTNVWRSLLMPSVRIGHPVFGRPKSSQHPNRTTIIQDLRSRTSKSIMKILIFLFLLPLVSFKQFKSH